MFERLQINAKLCNGCGICELICAFSRTGEWHPALSRIKVVADKQSHLAVPLACAHCVNPPCITACLMNLIDKDPKTGWTVRNEAACIGCRACEISCPFNACLFDYVNEVVVNCDLCKGNPLCVEYCPTGALTFIPVDEAADKKREEKARFQVLDLL